MFLAICDTCGRREIRGTRGIDALVNTDHGIELHFTCRGCGRHGHIGRGSPAAPPLSAVA
jgi:hypothetical protein